jgi:acid phosphatase class B
VYSILDNHGHRAIWENIVFLTGKSTTNDDVSTTTKDDKKFFQVIDRIHDVFFAGREQSVRSFTNANAIQDAWQEHLGANRELVS